MNQSYKEIKIYSFRRDKNGRYIKDNNGFYIPEDEKETGLIVRITDEEARINNSYMNARKMRYELIPDKKVSKELEEARKIYKETFGKKPSGLLKLETLLKKIEEQKNKE